MPGGSRIVFDLNGPARIAKSYVLDAANGSPRGSCSSSNQVDPHRLRPVARREAGQS